MLVRAATPLILERPISDCTNWEEVERSLLVRAQAGDRCAFRQIFEYYKRRVWAVALGITGNRQLAEDVTQEVFVQLFRSLPKYDPERRFSAYLYRITVNACFDSLKREKRRKSERFVDDNELYEQLADEPKHDPSQRLEQREIHGVVRQLAQRLSPQQRTAFVLRDVEGLELNEIARILKCRNSTVRVHLHLARKALRLMIESEYPEFLER